VNPRIDFDAIRDAAAAHTESLALRWLPELRRSGPELIQNCPFHHEKSPSFKININDGKWKCFGCGAGGDMIALYAELHNVKPIDAAKHIGGLLTVGIEHREAPSYDHRGKEPANKDWTPVPLAPDSAGVPNLKHPRFGHPVKVWPYRNAEGGVIGYVGRFEFKKDDGSIGKDVMPMTWARHTDGREGWRFISFPKPRPLYGLDLLAANPEAGVLIVEGEKAADAARTISPGVVVTWPGGGKAVKFTDWSPLAGRKVLIWPDADEPGHKAAADIVAALKPIAASVRTIPVPAGVAEGWDLADAVAEGWDRARLVEHIKGMTSALPTPPPAAVEAPEPPPGYDCPDEPVPPWEGTAPPNQPRFRDDRISDLPFRLLGVDGDSFFYMPDRGQQIVSLTASSHTKLNLMRLAPLQLWQGEFPDKSGADWETAANALIQRSQALPKFDPRRIRGRGCWIDADDVVFHAGDRLFVNGDEIEIPAYHSAVRAIYEGALEIPVDGGQHATNAEAARIIELCEMLSWERPLYGKLLAGWLALAPVCGALAWRPHLWVTGPSGSGKSWTVANIIQPLSGKTAVNVQGNTSEAGIRQMLGSDALPVVFDEAESEDKASQKRFDGVLELARQASTETGAGIVKGSATGGAVTYLIRSMFLFASIGVAAVKKADVSRVTVLPLRKNTGPFAQQDFDAIKRVWRETIGEAGFASRFRSRSLRYAKIIRANAETFSAVAVEFTGDKRSADQIGTLLAGAFSLTSPREITREAAREWMAKQDWTGFKAEDVDNDESQCLAHLFAAHVRFEFHGQGSTMSVSEIVEAIKDIPEATPLESDRDRRDALKKTLIRHGLRLHDGRLYVANRHQLLERIFTDTAWAGAKWRQQIERVTGAQRHEVMNFGPHVRQRATSIPL
jgi:putative DNA primase/helicase